MFIILSLLFYLKFIVNNNNIYSNIKGYDEREIIYPNLFKNNNESLIKILQINKIKTIIDLLESNETNIDYKLHLIDKNKNSTIFNLFEGGLFNNCLFF
jgi:hypothetical protein